MMLLCELTAYNFLFDSLSPPVTFLTSQFLKTDHWTFYFSLFFLHTLQRERSVILSSCVLPSCHMLVHSFSLSSKAGTDLDAEELTFHTEPLCQGENVIKHIRVLSLLFESLAWMQIMFEFFLTLQGDEFTLPYNASIWLKIGLCFEASEPNFLQA